MKVISLDGSINHLGMGPGCNGAMKAWSHRLGGRGGGVVQVAFFRRITKFLIKFFPEKFKVISWINP